MGWRNSLALNGLSFDNSVDSEPIKANSRYFVCCCPFGSVHLENGLNVAVDILFAHPRNNKRSASLHEAMGLATVNTPLGIVLKVDERREIQQSSAAGDLTNPLLPSVTTASWQGAMAGFAQQSMLS